MYSSSPGGVVTSNTLGTAAMHWYRPTAAFTLQRMPALRQILWIARIRRRSPLQVPVEQPLSQVKASPLIAAIPRNSSSSTVIPTTLAVMSPQSWQRAFCRSK
eukprot:1125932-Prymnesium_polylepis.3